MACGDNPECGYYPRCYEDTHHLYFPDRNYITPLEKVFRGLPENQVDMCREEHDTLHATTSPPDMPTRDEMLIALEGTMSYISSTQRRQIYGKGKMGRKRPI